MKYVPAKGPVGESPLMIIGIAPGTEETRVGEPFKGPSGQLLRQDLREAGMNFDDCYRTNVFKYQLPDNEFKKHQEIGLSLDEAIKELNDEILEIKPNCILGLGDPVLKALTGKSGKNNGINIWRGSILNVLGRKAIFTYHPAHELHGEGDVSSAYKPYQRFVRKFDISRAVAQSQFKEFRLPTRLLHVARNSADVYNFLERNKHQPKCAIDIESIECIPVCIGLAFTPHEAISIPLWNELNIDCDNQASAKKSYKYSIKVSSIPTGDIANIWKLLARFFLDHNYKFVGQNFKYDAEKLNRLGFYIWKLHSDIMLKQHVISSEVPKSLAFQTSVWTEEPYYKYEGKEFNPKFDKIEDLLLYNARDAAVTIEIDNAMEKELLEIPFAYDSYYNFRMNFHTLYMHIERNGFKVDEIARKELISKYVTWQVKLEAEAFEIEKAYGLTEPILLSSPVKVGWFLYEVMKVHRPASGGTGEEIITALLANRIKKNDQRRFCEILLDHRRVVKTIGTYLAAECDYDGRLRTSYFITGTENYRTSTQVVKQPIRPKEIGWAIQTVTKHGDIGQDLRSILVADKGYIFVNIDQSQAEARVCSHLADDSATLAMYDQVDIHARTAAQFFGGTEESYSKKLLGYECPERFVGKSLRHAYHLGVGKHVAAMTVNTDARKYKIDLNISEWKAGKCLEALRVMTPNIEQVYHKTIQELSYSTRRLHGTFGASRFFHGEPGRESWKEMYSFIPQQTVSDNTKRLGAWIVENFRDIFIVVEAHDALTMLVPERFLDNYVELILKEAMKPIDFSNCSIERGLLNIPWDVEVGYDYKELNKYKRKVAA